MRVGFIADTQGNIDYLVLAAERLLGPLRAEKIFFLGGAFEDLDELFSFRKKMLRGTEKYNDEHFLADITEFLADQAGVSEGDELAEYRKKFVRVPEPGCAAYQDEEVPSKQLEMVGSNIVLLVYRPDDIVKDDLMNASIIFHGAMGKHQVLQKGRHTFVCPGHLKDKENKGVPATFGLFELENRQARITFHDIAGEVVDEHTLSITKKGKITVQ